MIQQLREFNNSITLERELHPYVHSTVVTVAETPCPPRCLSSEGLEWGIIRP